VSVYPKQYEQDDGALTAEQLDQIRANQNAPVAWTRTDVYQYNRIIMTTRIVTDANGRKHITTEPLLHPQREVNTPVAWTRTDVYSPVIKEEMMLKHPELRQYYPVPLYYAPRDS